MKDGLSDWVQWEGLTQGAGELLFTQHARRQADRETRIPVEMWPSYLFKTFFNERSTVCSLEI